MIIVIDRLYMILRNLSKLYNLNKYNNLINNYLCYRINHKYIKLILIVNYNIIYSHLRSFPYYLHKLLNNNCLSPTHQPTLN